MGLFGFGKKKEETKKEGAVAIDKDAVLAKVEELKGGLDIADIADSATLDEIGKQLSSIDDVDGAIAAFEKSLDLNHTMGKASAALVKLYNKKRAEAATNKDDEGIKYYLDKVNEMLAISKDTLRGK